eukprot:TRINITY_DN112553_c0_g1_i1.p1 TRINITY_DN112553_c0_g1~~TRINITY_DN112553_c0_g1_i1.p1  ORF type:complete len:231 (+),score=26.46 TRINITY_DN112553_c0_g1_i1:51-743(+)
MAEHRRPSWEEYEEYVNEVVDSGRLVEPQYFRRGSECVVFSAGGGVGVQTKLSRQQIQDLDRLVLEVNCLSGTLGTLFHKPIQIPQLQKHADPEYTYSIGVRGDKANAETHLEEMVGHQRYQQLVNNGNHVHLWHLLARLIDRVILLAVAEKLKFMEPDARLDTLELQLDGYSTSTSGNTFTNIQDALAVVDEGANQLLGRPETAAMLEPKRVSLLQDGGIWARMKWQLG